MWITRKGAIRPRAGDRGVIPGSMGTRSYIVARARHRGVVLLVLARRGPAHVPGRGQARRSTFDVAASRWPGKAWNDDAKALLDEDPGSYKDIDGVMERPADLVEVEHTLRQVLNYKGT